MKVLTGNLTAELVEVMSAEEILYFQQLIRKVPVTENVYTYAVKLAAKTRKGNPEAHPWANKYLTWGAGPRASQYLIVGAKCHAALSGNYPQILRMLSCCPFGIATQNC